MDSTFDRRYYVRYVRNSEPQLISFEFSEEMIEWTVKFKKDEDCWIDEIYFGNLFYSETPEEEYYE